MAQSHKKDDLVSVIIPVFNAAAFLRQAVESVIEQTYSELEILAILDPHSVDESEKILYAFKDPRLRILRAQSPGVSAARNLGLQNARGRYVAFLDADDFWLCEKLQRQLHYMTERQLNFSATNFRRVDERGLRTGRLIRVPEQISQARLLKQNSLCCSSVLLDLQRVGPVMFEDVGCEDFALWLQITGRGLDGYGIPEDLVRYRVVKTSRGASKLKTARESWALIRRNLDLIPALMKFAGFLVRGAVKHSRF